MSLSYFLERLHATFDDHPFVSEVRDEGLLAALEFMADKEQRVPFDAAHKVGLRVSAAAPKRDPVARAMPHGDIPGFAPPLVTTRADVDEIVHLTRAAVDEIAEQIIA